MIKGKVIRIGQLMEGISKTKGTPWKKQEYVIETEGQYPQNVAFSLMNDKIDNAVIQMGDSLEIEVDPRSREYNGRWYTELIAWRVKNARLQNNSYQQQTAPVYNAQAPQGYSAPQYPQNPQPTTTSNGDPLPF